VSQPQLIILCDGPPSTADKNIARIAQHLGVSSVYRKVDETRAAVGPDAVIAASWDTLQKLLKSFGADSVRGLAALAARSILAYGWCDSKECREFAADLTGGAVAGINVNKKPNCEISVAAGTRDLSRQLEGVKFTAPGGVGRVNFSRASNGCKVREIMSRDAEPFFLETDIGGTGIFLLGAGQFADLDSRLPKKFALLDELEGLAPLVMFVRKNFSQQCWEAEKIWGCLIIDDPLLRMNYGFLNYADLLTSMESHRYSTCIAFIPWNYRRTAEPVARVFNQFPHRLSICVHGCDHTGGEFATTNEPELRQLLHSALWRMEQHQSLSTVPFDPVMVFPQGRFSHVAMKALGESRIPAVINSSPFPVDYQEGALTLAEMCEPAITSFSECSLFVRHYPRIPAEFAFDLFLGKPLLIVEHHKIFQGGTKKMEEFVDRLNAMDDAITWSNPATICSQACLRRSAGANRWDVRFYTDQFTLTNRGDQPADYTLFRRLSPGRKIESVHTDGKLSDWSEDGDYLKLSVHLDAGQKTTVAIARVPPPPLAGTFQRKPFDETKARLRRHLSEFRDNFVDKSPWATHAVRAARGLVKKR